MRQSSPAAREQAEALGVQALTFIAADPQRLGRFLALTGIGPERIRAAAAEPGFLAGVLEHVAADEALLRAFSHAARIAPIQIDRARTVLSGPAWDHEPP